MSIQELTLNSDSFALVTDSIEQLEHQVNKIILSIHSLANTNLSNPSSSILDQYGSGLKLN
jgi:hypothetical protein